MYNVSEFTIRRIFITWIMFLFHHFKEYKTIMFPERHSFRKNLPAVFRKFKNIRCILDCTEFYCETPRNYAHQGHHWSAYKHHTTMKCLVAILPTGGACFVFDVFEGSIDDVQIFKDSGILDYIRPGDSVMVDRGFTVQELLLPKQATIFIPPFLAGREKLSEEEEILTKRITKARIHVERFNERLKLSVVKWNYSFGPLTHGFANGVRSCMFSKFPGLLMQIEIIPLFHTLKRLFLKSPTS